MKCYRTGYDYKAHFRTSHPDGDLLGDLDKIASAHSTAYLPRGAQANTCSGGR